jgi:hypothetical protein
MILVFRNFWGKPIALVALEVGVGFLIFVSCQVFFMLAFGEGEGSLKYDDINDVIGLALPISLPTGLNLFYIYRGFKFKKPDIVKIFTIAEGAILFTFILFILYV